MTLSYNWLCEYLPLKPAPEQLSAMLTSLGLEVESMEKEGNARLDGLVVGEVLTCAQHPDADKLKITQVNIGAAAPLHIVCGAANVAVGQKVVVAPIGTTLYPIDGAAFKIKRSKIRGVESEGMICAEDEIGIGQDHSGIMVLPADVSPGTAYSEIYSRGKDVIFEIGLTPNRIDAMSHLGTARDVCAYLSYHQQQDYRAILPFVDQLDTKASIRCPDIDILELEKCRRYAGIQIEGIQVQESPEWLQKRLLSIGLKPINNIVDVTNFILHETGQPLHAFDSAKINGNKVFIQCLPAGTDFTALDGKKYKLNENDLMICDQQGPLCMAGVYGGFDSGVSASTKSVFLESAWFAPTSIRKSSTAHGLRTEAAARFEKGADISQTVTVLKRAAKLIMEICPGAVCSEVRDVYPTPVSKKEIELEFEYLRKLSGKTYAPDAVRSILTALGFGIQKATAHGFSLQVPLHKFDISLPCDLVEEIMRIDGLDHVEIPSTIHLSPATEKKAAAEAKREKLANMLAGNGFFEILTNSISNSAYYEDMHPVKMMNSLTAELNVMRPSMLESGLETIAFNLHRKNNDLRLFEFGKTYEQKNEKTFVEKMHLMLFVTGWATEKNWKADASKADFFYLKGTIEKIMHLLGVPQLIFKASADQASLSRTEIFSGKKYLGHLQSVSGQLLKKMDIKPRAVWVADMEWNELLKSSQTGLRYQEISRFPAVERDLALVLDKTISYTQVQETVANLNLAQLKSLHLFDIFESEKIGKDKKSMAFRFVFQDSGKTLTDEETDSMMNKLVKVFEKQLQAEIRK